MSSTSSLSPTSGVAGKLLCYASIAIASGFRLLPILISWPFPIGYDTNTYYLVQMRQPIPFIQRIFESQDLHLLVLSSCYHVFHHAFLILNVYALATQGILALEIYVYCSKVVRLNNKAAFFSSVAFTFSILTMRLTWDQYRIATGLIFAIPTMIVLSSDSKTKKWTAVPLIFLVIISNPDVTVLTILTLAVMFLREKNRKFTGPLFMSFVFGLITFSFQMIYIQAATSIQTYIPLYKTSLQEGIQNTVNGLEFVCYTSWPLLLLVPVMAWNKIYYHTLWVYWILFFAILLPILGIAIDYQPPAWLFWLMCFPLAVLAGQVLQYNKSNLIKKISAISFILLIFTATLYAVSSPVRPFMIPSSLNITSDMPTGYLQSTIPISEEKDLLSLMNSTLYLIPQNSTLYLGQQFYGLSSILPNPRSISIVDIGQIDSLDGLTFYNHSKGNMYTIWWTRPNGWYGVTKIPADLQYYSNSTYFSLYVVK